MWAFKSFLYTNPSFLSISAGFAPRQCCQYSHKDTSSWLLCLSQFCLCPLGVRLLSAQSPVPGISRRTREYEKAKAGVAFLGCSLACRSYPEKANWVLWGPLGHQMGTLLVLSQFYQLGFLQSHCSSLGCKVSVHRQQLLPQICWVLQHVCVLGHIAFLRSALPIATAPHTAPVSLWGH